MLMQVRRGDRHLSARALHRLVELESESGIASPLQFRETPVSYSVKAAPPAKKIDVANIRRKIQTIRAHLDALEDEL